MTAHSMLMAGQWLCGTQSFNFTEKNYELRNQNRHTRQI